MKVNKLLPNLYNNNIEMNAIANAEDKEFELVFEAQIQNNFENTFIATADLAGIERFEILFGIEADPETEDIEFRRQRLWNRLNTTPLFTYRYLVSKLNELIGVGNWYEVLNFNAYTLDIYVTRPGKAWLNELRKLLEKIVPCNIVWTIHIYAITWQAVKDNTTSWNDITEMTWQEVMEGEWIDA